MTVGQLLTDIVEKRKENVLNARMDEESFEYIESLESLFIDAVNAYAIWIAE